MPPTEPGEGQPLFYRVTAGRTSEAQRGEGSAQQPAAPHQLLRLPVEAREGDGRRERPPRARWPPALGPLHLAVTGLELSRTPPGAPRPGRPRGPKLLRLLILRGRPRSPARQLSGNRPQGRWVHGSVPGPGAPSAPPGVGAGPSGGGRLRFLWRCPSGLGGPGGGSCCGGKRPWPRSIAAAPVRPRGSRGEGTYTSGAVSSSFRRGRGAFYRGGGSRR